MRTALIYVRIIVAVCLTSAGLFFGQAVEGFQKYRGRLEMALAPLSEGAVADPAGTSRERLKTARLFKGLAEDAIREGEVTNLVVSGLFAAVGLCAILAGNRLRAELRKPP